MSLDIRIFRKVKNNPNITKCYRLIIGNSIVHKSVYWLNITVEDWEGENPWKSEVTYAKLIWSFWRYKNR